MTTWQTLPRVSNSLCTQHPKPGLQGNHRQLPADLTATEAGACLSIVISSARCTRLLGTSTLAKLLCLFLDSSGLILKWSLTIEEVYTRFLHTCNWCCCKCPPFTFAQRWKWEGSSMKSFFITVQWRWGRKRNLEWSSRAKPNRKVLMRMSPRGNDSVVWEEVMPAEREAAQSCCLGGVGLSFGFSG